MIIYAIVMLIVLPAAAFAFGLCRAAAKPAPKPTLADMLAVKRSPARHLRPPCPARGSTLDNPRKEVLMRLSLVHNPRINCNGAFYRP